MATLHTPSAAPARAIIHEVVKTAGTGADVAEQMKKIADDIETLRTETATMIVGCAPEEIIVAPDRLADLQLHLGAPLLPPKMVDALAEGGEEGLNLAAIRDTMHATAEDVATILDTTTVDRLEDGVVGQARLEQAGSSVIDLTKALHGDAEPGASVIDAEKLQDAVAHERQHEVQTSRWNAQSVDVGAHRDLTINDILETDAMNQQQSIQWVSAEYGAMHAFTTSLLTDEEIAQIAQTGDLLQAQNMVGRSAQSAPGSTETPDTASPAGSPAMGSARRRAA